MTPNSTFRRRADKEAGEAIAQPSVVSQPSRRMLTGRADVEATVDAFLRAGITVSVCVLTVDGLASYTESFGLEERRHMLSRLRSLVLNNVRVEDVFGEIGNSRFALLLPGIVADGAVLVAERLLLACRLAAWNCAPVSLSLGVTAARPGCLADERLQAAESAAMLASQTGGARVLTAA